MLSLVSQQLTKLHEVVLERLKIDIQGEEPVSWFHIVNFRLLRGVVLCLANTVFDLSLVLGDAVERFTLDVVRLCCAPSFLLVDDDGDFAVEQLLLRPWLVLDDPQGFWVLIDIHLRDLLQT